MLMPLARVTPYPGSLGDAMLEDVARTLASPEENIVIGADVADGTYGPRDWWDSEPDRIVSMSWSNRATPSAKMAFVRYAENGRTRFFVRDRYSLERLLRDVPQSKHRATLTADLAFLAESGLLSQEWESRLQPPTIAVLPKTTLPVRLVQQVLERGYRVVVIQHDLRRGSPMTPVDREQFFEAISSGQLCEYMPKDPSGYRFVRGILSRCVATLSGRLHGCISSFVVGTPAMMIADYRDKSPGVFEPFGLEWLVAESHADAEQLLGRMLASLSLIRERIAGNLDRVKAMARNTFDSGGPA